MKKFRLPRRHFLKGAGALIGLPILDCMLGPHGKAFATTQEPLPRRFGVYFMGNGVPLSRWIPTQTGTDWTLSECLAPLAPVKHYCNVLSGYDVLTAGSQPHHGGQAGLLSGLPYIEIPGDGDVFASKYRGPSIDQIIAQELNVPSIALGVSKRIPQNNGPTLKAISHENSDNALPPLLNPAEVFTLLFSDFEPPVDPRQALRKNILDAVTEDIAGLKNKMGTSDRQRLDAHLTGISELRQRILALPPEYLNACVPLEPVTITNVDTGNFEPLEEINRIMCDLWLMAWACDLTRVTSMMYNAGMSETVFHPLGGVTEGHYTMTQNIGEEGQEDLLSQMTFTVSDLTTSQKNGRNCRGRWHNAGQCVLF